MSVRRRPVACDLCRKRKIKCEPSSLLSCGPCQKIGAICHGAAVDDGAGTVQPRSLFSWLSDEVSRLEQPFGGNTSSSDVQDPSSPNFPSAQRSAQDLLDAVAQDVSFPQLGFSNEIGLPSFVLLSEPHRPIPRPGMDTDTVPSPLVKELHLGLSDMLLEIYISRTASAYPIFHEPWLRECHAAVVHQSPQNSGTLKSNGAYEIFTISLVVAVALSTAARANQAQANGLAFKLCQDALHYLPSIMTNDLAGLQALVLLNTYAMMNPVVANLYLLGGCMIQSCIDLGLHVEQQDTLERGAAVDLLTQDIQRRVFWSAWELDASFCTGLGRPIALKPGQITTAFPSEKEDSAIHPGYIDTAGRSSKFISRRVWLFRLLEVEIATTLNHTESPPFEPSAFETWALALESRIHSWRDDIYRDAHVNQDPSLDPSWDEMRIFSDISDPLILFSLYRPCPRVKIPTTANLLKAFKAAIDIVKGYHKQACSGFGGPKYTFQPCHYVFNAAMLFLHTMQVCPIDLSVLYTLPEIDSFISSFTDFFALSAERWLVASECRNEFLRLVQPVRDRYAALTGTAILGTIQPTEQVLGPDLPDYLTNMESSLFMSDAFMYQESFPAPHPDDIDTWLAGDLNSTDWISYFDFEDIIGTQF